MARCRLMVCSNDWSYTLWQESCPDKPCDIFWSDMAFISTNSVPNHTEVFNYRHFGELCYKGSYWCPVLQSLFWHESHESSQWYQWEKKINFRGRTAAHHRRTKKSNHRELERPRLASNDYNVQGKRWTAERRVVDAHTRRIDGGGNWHQDRVRLLCLLGRSRWAARARDGAWHGVQESDEALLPIALCISWSVCFTAKIPSKLWTLDLMETLNVCSRNPSYHKNAFYEKINNNKEFGSWRKKFLHLKIGSVLLLVLFYFFFFYIIHAPKGATILARKIPKFT